MLAFANSATRWLSLADDTPSRRGIAKSRFGISSQSKVRYDHQPQRYAAVRGGNVPQYERVSAELASHYGPDIHSLLDVGCGDGHALSPALAATAHPHALKRLTLLASAVTAPSGFGSQI